MFSLSTSGDCEVEKEKPRILPNMIPNLAHLFAASGGFPGTNPAAAAANALRNFSIPSTTPSTTSSSSPTTAVATPNGNNLFPPFLGANFAQQYYTLMQQQQNQFMAHFNAAKNSNNNNNGINGSNNSESNSSILSDSRASSTDDSSSKKIKVDNDGNVICPICDEKLPNDSNWEKHVEMERKNLIKCIESIKELKQSPENIGSAAAGGAERTMSSNRSKQKRESELQRIRSNQQKRLTLKSINPLSTAHHRNIENTFDSISTTPSSRSTSADKNFCKGCERHHDYLIISSTLDEPRCYECFRKFRQQTTFLPLSFTECLENDSSQHLHQHLHQQQHQQLTTPPSNHSVDGLLNGNGGSTSTSTTASTRKRPSSNCSSSNESIKSPSGINNEKRFKIEI